MCTKDNTINIYQTGYPASQYKPLLKEMQQMNTQANIYTQESVMYTKGNIMCIQIHVKCVQETTEVMINV